MIWSGVNPDIMYTRSGAGGGGSFGTTLDSYNAATGVTTVAKEFGVFASSLPANFGLNQMSRSMDDVVWAFTVVDGSGGYVGYLVWRKSTNQILLNQRNSGSNVAVFSSMQSALLAGAMYRPSGAPRSE
jgi:hypothetical protein